MSADNWAMCPRCTETRKTAHAAREAEIAAAYGQIPVDEFDAMRAEFEAEKARPVEASFREDYEFYGIEEGELNISYSGGCSRCGLKHTFKHSEALDITPEVTK